MKMQETASSPAAASHSGEPQSLLRKSLSLIRVSSGPPPAAQGGPPPRRGGCGEEVF
jgi:hypothetical protein